MRSRLGAGALTFIALTSVATAQRVDRSKVPPAADATPFVFPRMQTRVLDNGLRVIVVEDHALPLVAVRAVVLADSLDDPTGKEGLYALTAEMLREGTATRTGDQLAAAAARLGNSVSPFRFTTITQNFDQSLVLMADMLVHPSFPQPALERLKATLGANQQRRLQQPATLANRVFLSRLLGSGHPVARSTAATEATMAGITREDLQHLHATFFRPITSAPARAWPWRSRAARQNAIARIAAATNNTTIVVVGDVDEHSVTSAIAKAFGPWQRGTASRGERSDVIPESPTTLYLLDTPGAQQSYVFVGNLGPGRLAEDAPALEVMAPILGASGGSRLYDNLRERHSYMYSGTPATVAWRTPFLSVIGGSAAVATAKTDSALIEWLGELRRIREVEPSEREMTLARGALVGTLPSQIETDDLIANRIMALIQNGMPLDFYTSYAGRINAVTPAAVRTAAAKYIDLSHLVIVVAGDRKVVEPLLRAANLGPIVIVDDGSK